jgi:hypothetical protein
VFFGFIAAAGLISLVSLSLELLLVRRRPSVSLGVAPEGGAPATLLLRAAWTVWVGGAAAAALAVAALLGAVLALRSDNWFLALLLAIVGLWSASYLVPLVLGQVTAGGVYLSAAGIEHRRSGSWWRIGWEDVADVAAQEPLAVALATGAAVERGRTTRWGWKGEVRAPTGVLGIQTRYLTVDHVVLSFVLLAYKHHPEQREQLGTPASLEWEIFRA